MNEIINMMIGRDIGDRFPKTENKKLGVALEVKSLSSNHFFKYVSFNLHYGEILGVYGLMGAGRTEIMKSIFGVLPIDNGNIEIEGKKAFIKKSATSYKKTE